MSELGEKRRSRNREKAIKNIQSKAANPENTNCVTVELTEQQALSIYLRSRQLAREAEGISEEEKQRQIDICYAQRDAELQFKE